MSSLPSPIEDENGIHLQSACIQFNIDLHHHAIRDERDKNEDHVNRTEPRKMGTNNPKANKYHYHKLW